MQHSLLSTAVPRAPLIVAAAVLAGSVGLAALGPALGGHSPPPDAPVVAERTLAFRDMPDHSVGVFENGAEVASFSGEQGFVRGILRGLNRTRKVNELPTATPFHLAAYADGRVVLDDPSTGVRLDLAAFGSDNEAVFAHMLPIREIPAGERHP